MPRSGRWGWATAVLAATVCAQGGEPRPPDATPRTAIVVPFPVGGGASAVATVLAPAMAIALGAPVDVVHRPGDDGQAGASLVVAAEPDGRTLLLGSTASLVAPAFAGRGHLIHPVDDLQPIALIGEIPRIVTVHADVPAGTLGDLVQLGRRGRRLRCGHSDALGEFAATEFARLAGVALDCENFDGVSQRMREAVTSGRVELTFESAFLADIRAGQLRALAVTSRWRLPSLPGVPTASEAGVTGLEAVAWLALLAPKGTPEAAVARLRDAALAALARADVVAALQQRGYVIRTLSAVQTREFLNADVEQWRRAQVRRAQPK